MFLSKTNINKLYSQNKMPIRNIIFDWSGVISNDQKTVYETSMKVFARFGIRKISFERYSEEFELPYENFYKKYITAPIEFVERAYQEECETTPLPEIFPEAKEVLEKLKRQGIHITMFTSMNKTRLLKEMQHMGVEHLFPAPKTDIRNKVAVFSDFVKSNGYKKDETIYVGDMVHDIHAAKRAGIRVVAVTRGYDSREKLEKEKPDYLIDDLRELFGVVV